MRPLGFLSRHLAAKVFLAIAVVVGGGLAAQAIGDARRESGALKSETRESATKIAGMVVGAVEHSMLRGDGIEVRRLVEALRQRVPESVVEIYDSRGIEVFAPVKDPPEPATLDPVLAEVLADGERRRRPGGTVFRPIPAEPRCQRCHPDAGELRGVLTLDLEPDACADRREETLVRLVTEGFVHVMTAERADLLDDYFRELAGLEGLRGAAVWGADGFLAFGDAPDGLEERDVTAAAASGAAARRRAHEAGAIHLVPLPMEARCVKCHDGADPVRGVFALALEPPGTPGGCAEEELERVLDTSLRFIMLSALGRRIADFLDAAAATGAVRELAVYDHVGRRFWTTRHPEPPPHVAGALASGADSSDLLGADMDERVRVVKPLANREACMQCHGGGTELRGVVAVSLSTAMAAEARASTLRRRAWFTGAALAAILALLVALLHRFVVRPVRVIEGVAARIGDGDLAVSVPGAAPDGDEVARLGDRINQMVRGLRAKVQLEKFVSKGAAAAAEGAGLRGVVRAGERRAAVVLFSDIRGFTAYSETRSPEEVVAMLNHMLQRQAEIVEEHGGDIDKFVGDEVMAVFQGRDAEARAVRCALALVEVIHPLEAEAGLSVGVGVSAGEVVYGAVGSEARMDFTVIGDVVNTGARLCSHARAREVLVSEAVRAGSAGLPGVELAPGEPLQLKGKREPVPVYRATRC